MNFVIKVYECKANVNILASDHKVVCLIFKLTKPK